MNSKDYNTKLSNFKKKEDIINKHFENIEKIIQVQKKSLGNKLEKIENIIRETLNKHI